MVARSIHATKGMHKQLARGRVRPRQCLTSAAPLMYALAAAQHHCKDGHPECPQRLAAIQEALATLPQGAVVHLLAAQELSQWHGGRLLDALQLVHPIAYLQQLESICSRLQSPAMVDESTYIAPGSYPANLETAAAALACLDAVLQGSTGAVAGGQGTGGAGSALPGRTAFCLGRPPGHHVLHSRPMGFGLVNFVAVAAAHALRQSGIGRVMVVDWDVHHGNGTEEIFYSSSDVLYLSTHQAGIFPGTGKATSMGSGEGAGATINIPLPGGSGDAAMAMVWDAIVRPAATRFQPDILLVSTGYDGHWRDPLANLQFCSSTYHWLSEAAQQLAVERCGGRCVFFLEGGYHLDSLGESVAESFRALLGLPSESPAAGDLLSRRLLHEEPLRKVEQVVGRVRKLHRLG